MGDEDYGHHCPATGKVVGSGWISWDFLLARVVQTIEDHTDQNGILVWEKDAPGVEVEALKKIDRFQARVDSITKAKNYKPSNGEYFTPRVSLRFGEWPSMKDYYKKLAEESADTEDDDSD